MCNITKPDLISIICFCLEVTFFIGGLIYYILNKEKIENQNQTIGNEINTIKKEEIISIWKKVFSSFKNIK